MAVRNFKRATNGRPYISEILIYNKLVARFDLPEILIYNKLVACFYFSENIVYLPNGLNPPPPPPPEVTSVPPVYEPPV